MNPSLHSTEILGGLTQGVKVGFWRGSKKAAVWSSGPHTRPSSMAGWQGPFTPGAPVASTVPGIVAKRPGIGGDPGRESHPPNMPGMAWHALH